MKYAYFKGKIVPFEQATVGIMTHALNYGTGCFEGIRAYWNEDQQQMYVLKLVEHYMRLIKSCEAIHIKLNLSLAELVGVTIDLVKKNGYKQDLYIRPLAYKSEEKIGLGLHGIEDDLAIYLAPFGEYIDISSGIKVCLSKYRRITEHSMPQGAKLTGTYFNSSLAKAEALDRGFVEAITLSHKGNVAEGSGENIFMVKKEKLITPRLSDDILPGITRRAVMEMARNELGLKVFEKSFKPAALYTADELFFCGTGAQISPIVQVEKKKIGNGKPGPITKQLQDIYFKAVRGETPKYKKWCTPVY
ncbi:branched-chain-amino-acid transaminase [candidate division WOR-1 bacterium RIFOXYB2_FULL_42_35]|uniref:Branched-chain-amino-acid aminotransferase n=1 Tax=candidate division WOR-1 bacterium RIFOXYC2_FULL_41_25 TaxID=1802586 RepID=A0A1F4TN32_UNCSA|nr:MAG: branched-chain-amino-acid transaminase [candidate division WOR-1 bacterium RIFOXYA2_FULL_41_14]OGC24487.1 MAG: branched-chain-amino-acid transaminase [candidate division WOR-1 bacterium RIFOXYB2_FULL_42_35]OGC34104.1 MAG: branched-chain-amino-acid transaminase [candidate division WOR-1 bacterium RIFOXYC2_FULL_41_25]OGC42800.1 MAG: branched-chain-amino-acid transaminase [candidate division WOR-1 bacterium RIFOXYD2_FULL_41_8]